ncbi:MAG: DinB family protein [Candidatus Hydrogenedentota bacterium]
MTDKESIMGSVPKHVVLGGIVEHTAHHRGALTVYTRLAGKVPAMPYM